MTTLINLELFYDFLYLFLLKSYLQLLSFKNVSLVLFLKVFSFLELYYFSVNSAVTSFKGLKPGRPDWINQDNYFLVKTSHGSEIYCVLDGHGEDGHLVSRKCRADMPNHIVSCNFDLKRAFAITQQNLLESKDMNAGCSGATCVLAILSHHSLTLAHAGDSRAVMGKRTAVGGYSAVVLTQDHKPDRPDEKKRILACGGHVGSRQVMIDTMGGRVPSNVTTGPCRVWYKVCNNI